MLAWNNRLYACHYFKSNQDKHNSITTICYFSHSRLGCFNPILGKIWTNPAIGLLFLNYIFNPIAGFVHILSKIGLKQPSIF